MTDLRDRIASAIYNDNGFGWSKYMCEEAADAVIAELGAIPDREFTDPWGHHWEWCGGVPGTWAWRITRLEGRR
jgi:hypothetical protein